MMRVTRHVIVVICVITHVWSTVTVFPKLERLIVQVKFVSCNFVFQTYQKGHQLINVLSELRQNYN